MAKKINTVVAKAIIKTAADEVNQIRKAQEKVYKRDLLKQKDHQKLISINGQIEKLKREATAIEQRIKNQSHDAGYNVYFNWNGSCDVEARRINYKEDVLVAECILMSEAGKTIDQIKDAVRKKLMS